MTNLPKHVAIIMDGNGRWAKNRGLNRVKGHERGAEVVREITTAASDIGIKFLTLYAFSTENWKRPKMEVEFLMKLLDRYLKNELPIYMKENVKFETVGDLSKFSKTLQKTIQHIKNKTKNNSGLTQILALNYGSRDEIIRAIKKLNENHEDINEQNLEKYLDSANFGDVDLLIRTSGEVRVSNFLLWQIAYAEMVFTDTLWPDFNKDEFYDILKEYGNRDRRFGGV
ncbi:MAG: di-trans,poly-cis-decaprenylcistransferase [Campylobacterales bacterium]|nr:di-trans,poly-cis-decaprenylcistransferase [Campylobacterales bacterium]